MFSIWVNQKKRKEEINLSQSCLRYPKPEREEHLFSTQLISQEKNPAMEINHFEGSRPEWLVPKRTLFFAFGRWQDLWEGEREITYWCILAELTLSFSSLFFSFFVFCFFSYLSSFFFLSCYSLFLFLGFQVLNPIIFLTVVVVTVHSKGFFL